MTAWSRHLHALEHGLLEVDRRLADGDVEGATALAEALAAGDRAALGDLPPGSGTAALRVLTRLGIVREHLAEALDAVGAELTARPAPTARREAPVARFVDQAV